MNNPSDTENQIIPISRITDKIYMIRGVKGMFDRDLAVLYGVSTKALNQAVKRNIKRFPEDFMFILTAEELENWRSQIVTSNPWAKMGLRRPPSMFTEQGIAMLSSVLNSERAILVNIQIIRTFTRLRELLATHEELRLKLESLEKKYDEQFKIVFDAFRRLLDAENEEKSQIGFDIKTI